MEDNGIHIDVPEENLHSMDEVLNAPGTVIKLVSRGGSPEDDFRKTILATQLISPVVYTPNGSSSVAVTVSGQVSLPTVTSISLSNHVAVFIGGMDPVINSTLTSNVTILSSSSTWSHAEIGAVILVSLMVPFILVSNIFVILSIFRFRRLRTPTNYFITSLAAVDIFVALATPFGIVVEVFQFSDAARPQHAMLCLLPNRVLMMACGVSVLTLAAIAYDRHTALVFPLEYVNIMTSRKVAIIITLSWIYSIVIVWLPLMVGWYSVPSNDAPCSANLIHGKAPVLFLSAIFVPSCLAILVCYFRIFLVARHHVKAIAALEFAVHRRLQVKYMLKDTKYAKTLALVIGVFLALWLPYLICIFIKTVGSMKFDIWVQTYLILLAVFNSGINPWIYAFKNSELRAAFKKLYRELCRKKSCKSAGRRSSMVSAISCTPRLSLTDGRMVSVISELTLDTSGEKLGNSLDFLDDYETKYASTQSRLCSLTYIEEISSQSLSVCLQQSRRQAAICCNMNDARDDTIGGKDSLTYSRSVSIDLALTREFLEPATDDVFDLSDARLYYQAPACGSPMHLESVHEGGSPMHLESGNEADMLNKISISSSPSPYNVATALELPARSSLPTYLQQPATPPCPGWSAQPYTRDRPSSLASPKSPLSYTTVSPTRQQHTSSTSSLQHSSSPLPWHTSVTPLQSHISTASQQLSTSATSLQQEYNCYSTSATSLQQEYNCYSTSATSLQQEYNCYSTSATSVQQDYNCHSPSCCISNTTLRPEVSCWQGRYSCDNLSYIACHPARDRGMVGCTQHPDLKAFNSLDPRVLSHTKSCPAASPVSSYYFLLPICETLALGVISRAARLENCVHLASQFTCDNRILMQ